MLEKQEYRSFTRNLSKILDDCKLSKGEALNRPTHTYFDDTGKWEATKHIHYYFDIDKTKSHKDEVLSLCRDLPKMPQPSEVPGFAGFISPVALLYNPSTRTIFMDQAMQIDEFALLIVHLDLGFRLPIEIDGNKSFVIAIFEEFKEQIQAKAGQEPADD